MQPFPDNAYYIELTNYLQKYLYSLTHDQDMAEEVTQQALLRGVLKWEEIAEYSKGRQFVWHKITAKFMLYNHREHLSLVNRRRAALMNPVTGEENPAVPMDESSSTIVDYLDLMEGLSHLPSWQQRALLLTGAGYTAKEQAEMEGTLEQNIASRVFKGRKELRLWMAGLPLPRRIAGNKYHEPTGTQGPNVHEGSEGHQRTRHLSQGQRRGGAVGRRASSQHWIQWCTSRPTPLSG